MRYVIIRSDSEGNIAIIGKSNDLKVARNILKNDFEEWLGQKEHCSECGLGEESAWLNGCHHVDFDWKIIDTSCDDVLDSYICMKDLVLRTTEDNPYISGIIQMEFNTLLKSDFESVLDEMSYQLTGTPLLMDITYKPIDVTDDGNIIVWVRGDVSNIIEVDDEMLDELESTLFNEGVEALEDFTGLDLSKFGHVSVHDDKDTLDNIFKDTFQQMPDEEAIAFYRKYCSKKEEIRR